MGILIGGIISLIMVLGLKFSIDFIQEKMEYSRKPYLKSSFINSFKWDTEGFILKEKVRLPISDKLELEFSGVFETHLSIYAKGNEGQLACVEKVGVINGRKMMYVKIKGPWKEEIEGYFLKKYEKMSVSKKVKKDQELKRVIEIKESW